MNDTHPHETITLTPTIPSSLLSHRIQFEPSTEAIIKYYSELFEELLVAETKDSAACKAHVEYVAISNFYFYQFTQLPKLISDRLFVALIGKSHGRMSKEEFLTCFKSFGKGKLKKCLAILFLMMDFDYDGLISREDARALLNHIDIFPDCGETRFSQQHNTQTEIERELDLFFKKKSKPMSFDSFMSASFNCESYLWFRVSGLEQLKVLLYISEKLNIETKIFCFERKDAMASNLTYLPNGVAYFSGNIKSSLQQSIEFSIQSALSPKKKSAEASQTFEFKKESSTEINSDDTRRRKSLLLFQEGTLYRKVGTDIYVECLYQLRGSEMYLIKSDSAATKSNTTIYLDQESRIKDCGETKQQRQGVNLYCFILFDRIKARSFYTTSQDEHEKWINTLTYLLNKPNLEDKYRIKRLIGQGSYGTVHQAEEKQTGRIVAIKTVKKDSLDKYELQEMKEEIEIMQICHHPNIVELYEVMEDTQNLYLVMEYIEGDTLHRYMKQNRADIPESEVREVIHQIAMALYYLRDYGIVHRDLKPENIMWIEGEKPRVKLLDFGLSTIISPKEKLYNPFGSLAFTAPQILKREQYSFPVDIYSLGVIAYELFAGTVPFKNRSEKAFIETVLQDEPCFKDTAFQIVSKDAIQFIKKMLQKKPQKRITIEEILTTPWVINKNSKLRTKRLKCKLHDRFISYVCV